jgi:hypothetical protein
MTSPPFVGCTVMCERTDSVKTLRLALEGNDIQAARAAIRRVGLGRIALSRAKDGAVYACMPDLSKLLLASNEALTSNEGCGGRATKHRRIGLR